MAFAIHQDRVDEAILRGDVGITKAEPHARAGMFGFHRPADKQSIPQKVGRIFS